MALEKKTPLNAEQDQAYQKIIENIKEVEFGSVIVEVQDGKIVQIEKSEKVRVRK